MESSSGAERRESAKGKTGRAGQRARTRQYVLDAAREMLAEGESVTVQSVAARTGVSRATIYRYFPTNDDLVIHAASPDADDPLEDPNWAYAPGYAPSNPVERAGALVRTTAQFAFDREKEMRALLRVSLEPDSAERGLTRQGRTNRHRWIASLVSDLPEEVPKQARDRLTAALMPLFGSDAVVWTKDMAGLNRTDAIDLLAWMAEVLVRATIDETAPD